MLKFAQYINENVESKDRKLSSVMDDLMWSLENLPGGRDYEISRSRDTKTKEFNSIIMFIDDNEESRIIITPVIDGETKFKINWAGLENQSEWFETDIEQVINYVEREIFEGVSIKESNHVKDRRLYNNIEELQQMLESTVDPGISFSSISPYSEGGGPIYYDNVAFQQPNKRSEKRHGYYFVMGLEINNNEDGVEEIEVSALEINNRIRYSVEDFLDQTDSHYFHIDGESGPFRAWDYRNTISIIKEMLEYAGY